MLLRGDDSGYRLCSVQLRSITMIRTLRIYRWCDERLIVTESMQKLHIERKDFVNLASHQYL